ncbi:hypothetical protein like AT3G14470 [Hibiscus trionum]|uniref:Disease resistance protein RGA3 n=1 Tax=Hibiscus trionum TaxID=183268 RepID=A0A9W7M1V1_HIBTR|nr:hypothetical protein like AT3G14470 [Hibiscus trionum]
MAETFLFTIAERVLEKIAYLSVEEARLAFNVESDLNELKETVTAIKSVLLDAEQKQHRNEKLRLCMWKLRDIFYDAEDVIDDFNCEALRKQDDNHPGNEKVRFLASCCLPLPFSLKMGHKIKEINQRLNKLATEWNRFDLGQGYEVRRVFHRETHSYVHSSDVIGRDDDKENIVDLLMKPSDDRNIPVIPIVGIGGLGKTTLAQFVYNDYRVTSSFSLKIWMCVSEEFDLSRLLKLIIQSVSKGEKCDDSTVDAMQTRLRNLLNDEKFLLVLDDVWNENHVKWNELRDLLRSMGSLSQSKIIVTTRSLKVASIMSSTRPYELKGLPLGDCMTLFTKWAFSDGNESRHPNLMRIGEEIVKKCKGVPLAVRTLGSLLLLKTDASDWISIRDSEIWRLEQSENDILPVLKLSYNHLPSHLQRCLAFLSLYKKDEVYNSKEVVQFWMANGLLEHPKPKQEWEDVGNQYLNGLQSRCLIQKEKDYGMYCTFKMHDLIHDLASDVSQKECRTLNHQTELIDKTVRHLSFRDETLLKVPHVKKLKNVRTVIIHGVTKESLMTLHVSKFKYLRVLRLCDSHFTALPDFIGTLKHLRDLDLTDCRLIQKLPSSFYRLQSLQTLRMKGVPLLQWPDIIESLIELRYLEITIKALHLKAIRSGCWPSLQYLAFHDCDNLQSLFEGMQHLTSLRGLVLYNCPNLVSLPRSLKFLTKLEDLCVSRCKKINLEMEPEDEEDINIQLSLKTFLLSDSDRLTDLPQLLLERSASTLQQIKIINCSSFVVLPPWLQHLIAQNCQLYRREWTRSPNISPREGIN